jgi:RNA polymerase sigma-70 factor (ECF subfamily)
MESADCDDVVSEVFLVAWRRLDELPDDPLPWLLVTARRVVANHWRGRVRLQRHEAELRALARWAGEPDVSGGVVRRSEMLDALGRLSADDREVLLLVGWDGLDTAGVARVLDCAPGAARMRLSRARQRLEEQLGDQARDAGAGLRLLRERS